MKICNGLLIALMCVLPTTTSMAKKKKVKQVKQPCGPIANPNQYPNRAVVITCPVCPNFLCTGITGITGITGCTGPGCTGPCVPDITSFFCCLNVSQSATVRGSVIAETEDLAGSLGVTGNANFKSELIVQGNGNLQQDACIGGSLSVGNDVNIAGFEVVLGTFTTEGNAIINGGLTNNGNQLINGSLTVTGNSNVGQNLLVNGSSTISGLLTANGGPTGPSLNVYNGSIVNNGLTILNTGCTAPTGPLFCTGASIGGNVCLIGDELVVGDFDVNGELTVDKNALFNGDLTVTGTLIANNSVIMNDGLTIANGDQIINAGNLNLIDSAGILQVGEFTTLQGVVTTNAGALVNGGMLVDDGGVTVPVGDFSVPQGSVIAGGSVSVGGTITSSAGQSQFGSAFINSTENALCSTGPGALVVAGGVGIAKDLWEGGCQFFANVEAEGGTPGCLQYYEETCFSTSFVWGGQPVTPATSLLVQVIRVGNVVNIIIPEIIINNPGAHIDVISSSTPLPARFRPNTTVRGAASTVITNNPSNDPAVVGQLGEFNVSPSGIISIGLPGAAISPQRILSTDYVYADINTITYNVDGCAHTCKRCAG